MIISKKRIKNLDRYISNLANGTEFIPAVKYSRKFNDLIAKIGFATPLQNGETILPPASFGPVNRKNVHGYFIKHKDKPMETAYRIREWCHEEWRGRGETETVCKDVKVSYKRYPRTFIFPFGIEISIVSDANGNKLLTVGKYKYGKDNGVAINAINVLLEIFGECEILQENLNSFISGKIVKLNWEVLPKGKYPWEKLKPKLSNLLNNTGKTVRPFIERRFEKINEYEPEFSAIGIHGFKGYIVFGFPEKNLFILESTLRNNATYVFAKDWELISKLTKYQILQEALHKKRIIHKIPNWYKDIETLFK
ncbi:hypothetical protein LEP1GSC013_1180 [Leptospira interrogans serovar Valbuzzi str. Duyster]|uniref:hypothetical protein n=1 Tax=Leptospira interrogans TaxID=173 RepID=UPI0002BC4CB8|nr:hypothetical protein [Leptospira interrogans]EMJ55739.1 hypothetical protein LEP1GSC013_1180 [Leptospira interrogans serovar Valbuzzi str. Duyster]ENO74225.1 hypothetical protein LEP1GSC012_3719 [Leptospira interrogans serovar Valbuzzi str. Valbuzzi]